MGTLRFMAWRQQYEKKNQNGVIGRHRSGDDNLSITDLALPVKLPMVDPRVV
jgi:hypothetical protein